MRDPWAEHMPRARSERQAEQITGTDQLLYDWSDDNWLQFSSWHTHQIKAYVHRALPVDTDGAK